MEKNLQDNSSSGGNISNLWSALIEISTLLSSDLSIQQKVDQYLSIINSQCNAEAVSLVYHPSNQYFSKHTYVTDTFNLAYFHSNTPLVSNFVEKFFVNVFTDKYLIAFVSNWINKDEGVSVKVKINQVYIPIYVENHIWAVQIVHSTKPYIIPDLILDFLKLAGSYLSDCLIAYIKDETAMLASERLRQAQRIAKIGHWEYIESNATIRTSDETQNILGVESDIDLFTIKDLFVNLSKDDTQRIFISFDDSILNNKDFEVEFVINHPLAGIRHAKLIASNNNGKQKNFKVQGIIQDITQQKLLEENLNTAKLRAEEADHIKSIFLANMSHEIKTPLNAIIGFTKLLQSKDLIENQKEEYLDFISSNTRNLLFLINDIIDIAKIQSGQLILNPKPVVMSKFFEDLQVSIENQIKIFGNNNNVELRKVNIEFPEGYTFVTDHIRLKQVLLILISNAIKYTPKGFIEYGVRRRIENKIEFYIKDTGIGIPEEKISMLFNQFGKIENGVYINPLGTGIGLSLAKFLIEGLGGEMHVESKTNLGTTFIIELKLGNSESEVIPKGLSIVQSINSDKYTVLVVEDNLINQRLLIDSLQVFDKNLVFLIANNGKEGIEMMQTNRIDIVIMDIRMPVMDGMQATKYIRNHLNEPACRVPIIALTAHALKDEAEKCLEIGMNSYFTKPFIPNELYAEIQKLLSGNKLNLEIPKTTIADSTENVPNSILTANDFDFSMLLSLYNHNYVKMIDILRLYLEQIPLQIYGLKEACVNNDWKKVRTIAHSIKSTMNYLGMKQIHISALEIEQNIDNEQFRLSVNAKAGNIEIMWMHAAHLLEGLIDDWTKIK